MMHLTNSLYSLLTQGGNKMPKNNTALAGLVVLCFTILCGLWMFKDSLCELQYKQKDTYVLARFVVYETR